MIHSRTTSLALVNVQHVLLGILISAVTVALSLAIVTFILIKLPPTYFQESHPREYLLGRHPSIRWAASIGKNLLGLVLVLLGIAMSIPSVPGQGVLTILLGIMLIDFPGKRRLESKLVSRPKVLATINSLRRRFGKPPLVLD